MKYMLLCYDDGAAWEREGQAALKAAMDEAVQLTHELNVKGQYILASPLESIETATSVRVRGGKRLITDGPFAETREHLGGFYLIDVASREEAIEIAGRHSGARQGTVEVRPIMELPGLPEPKLNRTHTGAQTMSKYVQPYLFFGGRCEEALEFYRTALGAEVSMLMRYSDSPEPPPPGTVPPNFANKVMHCSFRVGNTTLMASDGCDEKLSFSGFSLSLTVPTEAEADRAFSALAAGGQVTMPLSKTFWSPKFGMLTDRFGIGWMVSVEGQQA